MAPVIRIPEDIFKRLQKHAIPFEDTPASVIGRLLDLVESRPASAGTTKANTSVQKGVAKSKSVTEIARATVKELFGLTPRLDTDLAYSKILQARLGDSNASDWADLYRLAHRLAFHALGSLDALQQRVAWEIPKGRKRAKGFEHGYIEELGFSVRGVDSETAWKRSKELAELCQIPIQVTALGADNKRITLEWKPT